jgi:CheY-like chemotaxis protein
MCPENAMVFLAEDDPEFRGELIPDSLRPGGHQVVLSAGNLEQALQMVDRFSDFGVQVAIIDANLAEGDYSGRDGRILLKAIREKAPGVKIVGCSQSDVPGVDVNVRKKYIADDLASTVTNL